MNCRKCPESMLVLKDGEPAEMVMDPNSETCKSCMDELIKDTIERHKESLDMLAKDDGPVLKPCPFCGGESRLFETGFCSWIVACTKCCCRTHEEELEEDAIRIWNRRVRE